MSNKYTICWFSYEKKNDDPTVSYERECNKKVAPNLFDLDVCGKYGTDNDTLTNKYLARLNKVENDKKIFADYNVETCMIDKVMKEDSSLDDTNFKTYFSQYFDTMNSNIDVLNGNNLSLSILHILPWPKTLYV